MIRFISSELGVSMKANPFDSWVSGLRITFTSSNTRFSAFNQDLISSLVTHTGKFPRNTVKLILRCRQLRLGIYGTASPQRSVKLFHRNTALTARQMKTCL